MQRRLLLILLPVFCTLCGRSQDSLSLPFLSVEEAIATALQNNYDIQLARNDSAVAALDYAYRHAAFLPRLNANATYLLNTNAQQQTLADGTKRNRTGIRSNNLNSSLGLDWVVFDGLRMFITRDKLAQYVRLGELVIKDQLVNTVAAVINNYYNIVREKQQLRTIDTLIALNEDRYRLAQYRFDVGVGVKPDVLQAQLDLNAQRSARLNELTLIAQLKQDLNQLMNIAPVSDYDVSDTIPINPSLTLGELQSGIETTNTALRIARQNTDIAYLTIRERKAERFPTLGITSAYNFSRNDNKAVINPFQPLFNQNRGFNYGLTVSVPILNNFNTRRLIRQAQLSASFSELQYNAQRSTVITGLLKAFQTYDGQKQILALEEENIKLAEENLFIARERYRLAVTSFLELREAQQSLEESYNRLIAARYNTKVAETELLRLKGALVR